MLQNMQLDCTWSCISNFRAPFVTHSSSWMEESCARKPGQVLTSNEVTDFSLRAVLFPRRQHWRARGGYGPLSWSLLGTLTAASAGGKERDRTGPGLGFTSPNVTGYRLFEAKVIHLCKLKRGGVDSSKASSCHEIDGKNPLWTVLLQRKSRLPAAWRRIFK